MNGENIDGIWGYVVNHEKLEKEIEDKILYFIAASPFDKDSFQKLVALLEYQESMFEKLFLEAVRKDLDVIFELLERGLLD